MAFAKDIKVGGDIPSLEPSVSVQQRGDVIFAVLLTSIMAVFTQVMLGSALGFDDANITMNYAENIANGHGYVYYVGGERVEGSTSPLWTSINALAYLVGIPIEVWLAAIGFGISIAVITSTLAIARSVTLLLGVGDQNIRIAVGIGFCAVPTFFGWVIWSYMDIGLWILLCTTLFYVSLKALDADEWSYAKLTLLSVALVLCRPEGVAFACLFAAFLGFFLIWQQRLKMLSYPLAMVAVSLVAFGILAGVRLQYFGFPVPNTFYAKVSTNFVDQIGLGAAYTRQYLTTLPFPVLLLSIVGILVIARKTGSDLSRIYIWSMPLGAAFAAIVIYTTLGGDHFGSFRFYQFLTPISVAYCAAFAIRCLEGATRLRRGVGILAASAILIVTTADFLRDTGGLRHSLMVGVHSREVGHVLESWTEKPSVGVIPAGGISITYSGVIYDLMGLNWVDMAMAGRGEVTEFKNHGGFDKGIFYATLPDLVDPHFGPCDEARMQESVITRTMLDHILIEQRFLELYEFACRDGLVFYQRR